ncbi:uncharacterized protein LOC143198452 [Rhynchophorus ferrugineus]|uniref:uncharacterized protein LOC143198452 n=1 Tax=Rhynchophorus ferrugineus TaxID=354439 RepID=UPI003FCCD0FF
MSLLPYIFDQQPSEAVLSWPSLVSFDDDFFKPQRLCNVWEQLTQTHKDITIDKEKFQANIDVQQYKPEEITVKMTGEKTVTIEGKHEESPENGYVSRSFVRNFTLPEDCDAQKLQTKLSSEGLLVLSVPMKNDTEKMQISEVGFNQNSAQKNFEETTREKKRTTKKTVNQSSTSSQQSVYEHNKKIHGSPNAVASTTYVQESVYHESQTGNCPAQISQSSRTESSEQYNKNQVQRTNIPHHTESSRTENIEHSAHHQKEQVRRMSNSSVVLESSGTASPIIQFPESPDVFSGRNKFIGETQQSSRSQKRQVRTSSNSSLIIEQIDESVSNKNDRKVKDIPPLPTGRSKTTTTEEQIIKEERQVRNAPVNVVESTSVSSVEELNYNEQHQTQKSERNNNIVPTIQESPIGAGLNKFNTVEETVIEEHQVIEGPVTIVQSSTTKNIQQSTRQQKQQVRTSSNSSVVIEQVEESICNKNNKTTKDSPDVTIGKSKVTTTEEQIIKEEQHTLVKKPINKPEENNDVENPINQEFPIAARPTQINTTEVVPTTLVESVKTQQSTRQQKKQIRTSSNSSVVIEQVEESVCNKKNKAPKDYPVKPTGRSTITTSEEEIIEEEQQIRKIPTNNPKESDAVEGPMQESIQLEKESPVVGKPAEINSTEEKPQVTKVPVNVVESIQNVQKSTRQQKKQVKTSSNSSVVIEQVEQSIINKKNNEPEDSPARPSGRSTFTSTEEEIIEEGQQIRKIPINKPDESNSVKGPTYKSAPLEESPVGTRPNEINTVEEQSLVKEIPIAVVESITTQNVQQSTRQQKKQVKTSSNSSLVIEQVEESVSNKKNKEPEESPVKPSGRSTVTTTEEEIIEEEQQIKKIPVNKPEETDDVQEPSYQSAPLEESPVAARPNEINTVEEQPLVKEVPIALVESITTQDVQQSTRQQKKQVKTSSNSSVVIEQIEESVINKKNKEPEDSPVKPKGTTTVKTTEEEIIEEEQQIRKIPVNKPEETDDVQEPSYQSAPLEESPVAARPNEINTVEEQPLVKQVPITIVESITTQDVQQSTRQQKKKVKTSSNSSVVIEQVEESVSNKKIKEPEDSPVKPTESSTVTTTDEEIIEEEQHTRKIPVNKPEETDSVPEPTYQSAPYEKSPIAAKPTQISTNEVKPQVTEVPVTVVETTTQNVQQSTCQQKKQVKTSSNSSVVVEQVEESVSNRKNKAPEDSPVMPTERSTVITTEEEIIKKEQIRNIPIKIVESTSASNVEETIQNEKRHTQKSTNKPKDNGVEEPTYESTPLHEKSPVGAKPKQINIIEDKPQVREVPVTIVESTKTQNVQQSSRQQKQQVRTSSNSSVVIEQVEQSVCNKNNQTTKDFPALPTSRSKVTTTEEQIIKQQQVRNVPINVDKSTRVNSAEETNYKETRQSQKTNNTGHKTNIVEKTVIEEKHHIREVPINVVESSRTQNVQQSSTRQQKQQVRTSSNNSVVIEQINPTTRSKVITTEERIVKEQQHFRDVPVTIVDSATVRSTEQINRNQKQQTKKNVNKSETISTSEKNVYGSVPSCPIYPGVATGLSSNKVRETVIEERHHQSHYAQDVPVTIVKTQNIEKSSRQQQQQQVRKNSNSSLSMQNVEQSIYNSKHIKNVPVGISGVSEVRTTTEYVARDGPVGFTEATSVSSVKEINQNQRQQFTKSNNYRATEECSKLNQQQSAKSKNIQENRHHQQQTKKGLHNQSTSTRNVEESRHNQTQIHNGIGGETVSKKYEESKYQHNEQVRNIPLNTVGVSQTQNVQQINEHYQTSNTSSVRSSHQGGRIEIEKKGETKYYAPGLIDIKFD